MEFKATIKSLKATAGEHPDIQLQIEITQPIPLMLAEYLLSVTIAKDPQIVTMDIDDEAERQATMDVTGARNGGTHGN